jgi:GT2 family glycosyltransferase
MFKRKLFIDLGLLDELYNPFYWEDIDLSYRAWKAGYKILYDPNVKVEHHHESTIGKYFDERKVLKIAFRNQLIFHWKNLTDKDLIFKHLLNLPKLIFVSGFFDALIRLPKILKSRKKTIKLFKKTDREILDKFKQ